MPLSNEDLIKARGAIMGWVATIDNLICILISKYYFSDIREDFIFDVLYEKSIPLIAKHSMLKKIFSRLELDKTYLKHIQHLCEIRNIFAHAWIVKAGEDVVDLRKDEEEEYPTRELFEEFKKIHEDVFRYLSRIAGERVGVGTQTIPKGGLNLEGLVKKNLNA